MYPADYQTGGASYPLISTSNRILRKWEQLSVDAIQITKTLTLIIFCYLGHPSALVIIREKNNAAFCIIRAQVGFFLLLFNIFVHFVFCIHLLMVELSELVIYPTKWKL